MTIKTVFLVSVGLVQVADAISTYLALTMVKASYEANPVIAGIIRKFGPGSIFLYEIMLLGAVFAATEVMDRYLKGDMRIMLTSFYLFGFAFLVLHRFFFVVLSNIRVAIFGR